jgi:threonine aldolase
VLTFGGTKAGMVGGEAVIYLDATLAGRAKYVRKQVNQLPSKMRFVAAQFNALLADDLWIRLAEHSNAMGTRLHESTSSLPGVIHARPPQVNSVFPVVPAEAIKPLQDWCFFWDWDLSRSQVRWMASWDTTVDDIELFASGVRHLLG